ASYKARVLRQRLETMGRPGEFSCPALPDRPARAMTLLEAELHALDLARTTLVGSSLGGYYATYLVEKLGVRAVLVNPAVDPYRGLEAYLGSQRNLYTGEAYQLTQQHLDELRALDVVRPARPDLYY